LAAACAQELARAPVVVLADHGVFARGATIDEAVCRIEILELLALVALSGCDRSRE
jgi:ribulose-5-phosphate 4-epimerase/fuculose-1-phosphate aldolase